MLAQDKENAVLSGHRLSASAVQSVLAGLKAGLSTLYGRRFRGLYLYGSYARNEAQWDSDLDVLIVLDELPLYGAEIDRTGHLISSVSLEFGVSVSRVLASERAWRLSDNLFLSRVRNEATPA